MTGNSYFFMQSEYLNSAPLYCLYKVQWRLTSSECEVKVFLIPDIKKKEFNTVKFIFVKHSFVGSHCKFKFMMKKNHHYDTFLCLRMRYSVLFHLDHELN